MIRNRPPRYVGGRFFVTIGQQYAESANERELTTSYLRRTKRPHGLTNRIYGR